MCIYPIKNWKLNSHLDLLNDITTNITQKEIENKSNLNSKQQKETKNSNKPKPFKTQVNLHATK